MKAALGGTSAAPVHVFQYGVHDVAYPRNRRVREHLRDVPGVTVSVLPRARTGGRLRRAVRDLVGLLRGARGADVLLLSEFRLSHAALVAAVARAAGAHLVVDAFVGLHETVVGDERAVPPRSLRARRLALLDRVALRAADLVLVDTPPRADALRPRVRTGVPVLTLAVGAPSWATWRALPEPAADGELRILYYGGHLPLHGVDLVLEALADLRGHRPFRAVLLGGGRRRVLAERRVRELGLDDAVVFVDAVPESELAEHLWAAHVVLGVFGDSPKARSVVANKVWQGLACGRVVVTQDARALDELRDVVGAQLVTTVPGSSQSLTDALSRVDPRVACAGSRGIDVALEQIVTRSYGALSAWISTVEGGR